MSDRAGMTSREDSRVEAAYRRRDNSVYSRFNPGQLYLVHQQEREFLRALGSVGIDGEKLSRFRIFEVGCGSGGMLRSFERWGADPSLCSGADIRQDVIELGRKISPNIELFRADCADTGMNASSYDMVVQNITFSSVLDGAHRKAMAREMARIVVPGGLVVWCDLRYDNPRNPDVVGIGKRELKGLFPDCRCELCKPVMLVPPLARRLARVSRCLCDLLYLFPWLRGHYLAVFRKTEGGVSAE